MHRFFVDHEQIMDGRVRFREDQARQLRNVLRLRPGDFVTILDNSGEACHVRLEQVTREQADGHIEARFAAGGEPSVRLTLYQSLLNREKFEWVLQKGTELGVARFAPVITRRTLVRSAGEDKLARWRRILIEAAEQSGRGRLPELLAPISFEEALRRSKSDARSLIAWEKAGGPGVTPALAGLSAGAAIALHIGPEGGYDEEEILAARPAGAVVVSLGPRILRTETAAVVATSIVMHVLGELGELEQVDRES